MRVAIVESCGAFSFRANEQRLDVAHLRDGANNVFVVKN